MKKKILLFVLVVSALFAKTGLITWEHLNLRAGPGTRYKRLRNFEKGKYFEILGKEGNWIEANANGQIGYFYKDGIKEVKTIGTYIVRPEGVLFRWGPGERYDTLAVHEGGVPIEVVWGERGYFFGQFNGSGVWFDSSAVMDIVESAPANEEVQPAVLEEIPKMPVAPPQITEPVSPPPPEIVPQIVEEPPKKAQNRLSLGLMLAGTHKWVQSEAVDPSEDISIPTITIGDSYHQMLLGFGARGNLSIAMGRRRRFEVMLAPGFEYAPKTYLIEAAGKSYKLSETYLFAGLDLGLVYKITRRWAIAGGSGASAIGHKMKCGPEDEDADETLLDGWFIAPEGFAEIEYGQSPIKTVLGARYRHWESDNTRFFIADDGTIVPVGGSLNRNTYEVYFGVILSR